MSIRKKSIIILGVILILLLFVIFYLVANIPTKEVIVNKTTNLMNSDTISMMYENWYQSGEYETTSDVSWPGEGYVFNETLSKCENGGTLSWDEASKKVLMASNTSDKCYIYFDREPEKFANYIKEYIYTNDGENGIYLHDGQGAYGTLEAGDNSYRYSGGDYQVTEKAKQAGLNRLITSDASESDGVVNFYCNNQKQYVGSQCRTSSNYYYTLAYNESMQFSSYQEALNQAVTDGYLTSNNIKNYVCFGTDTTPCPEDNLYRIIGLFDDNKDGIYQVKLIKADAAGSNILGTDGFSELNRNYFYSAKKNNGTSHLWFDYNSNNSSNDWQESTVNKTNLNTNFWNNLTSTWRNKIAVTNWIIGGNTWDNIGAQNAKTAYTNELVNPATQETFKGRIGLMYVSDYMYGAIPDGWSNIGNNYDDPINGYQSVKGENWLYTGDEDWLITQNTDNEETVFYIYDDGNIRDYSVTSVSGVRPTFYLQQDVEYFSGTGTSTDPFIINQ